MLSIHKSNYMEWIYETRLKQTTTHVFLYPTLSLAGRTFTLALLKFIVTWHFPGSDNKKLSLNLFVAIAAPSRSYT